MDPYHLLDHKPVPNKIKIDLNQPDDPSKDIKNTIPSSQK